MSKPDTFTSPFKGGNDKLSQLSYTVQHDVFVFLLLLYKTNWVSFLMLKLTHFFSTYLFIGVSRPQIHVFLFFSIKQVHMTLMLEMKHWDEVSFP